MKMRIKWFYFGLLSLLVLLSLSSCFSLMKADRLIYAGSIGKKVDAAIIDSISRVDVNSEK